MKLDRLGGDLSRFDRRALFVHPGPYLLDAEPVEPELAERPETQQPSGWH